MSFASAVRALRERPAAVVDRWLAGYARSPLRVPGVADVQPLVGPARGIVGALALALEEADCRPGSAALRETEKLVAFAGGSFGMAGRSAFDVAAFTTALRDALVDEASADAERARLRRLFDWLRALPLEAFSSSRLHPLLPPYPGSLRP